MSKEKLLDLLQNKVFSENTKNEESEEHNVHIRRNNAVVSDKDAGYARDILKFPCLFSIKVMGINHPDLIAEVAAIVSRHAAHFNPEADIITKLSREKNYLSVTATIMATSQKQLDTIYTELNQHELVKITL
jgi:uncharacterized protein